MNTSDLIDTIDELHRALTFAKAAELAVNSPSFTADKISREAVSELVMAVFDKLQSLDHKLNEHLAEARARMKDDADLEPSACPLEGSRYVGD